MTEDKAIVETENGERYESMTVDKSGMSEQDKIPSAEGNTVRKGNDLWMIWAVLQMLLIVFLLTEVII